MKKLKSLNITYVVILICFLTLLGIVGSIQYYNSKITNIVDTQVETILETEGKTTLSNMEDSIQSIVKDLTFISNSILSNNLEFNSISLNKILKNYTGDISLENTKLLHSTSIINLLSDSSLSEVDKKIIKEFTNGNQISYVLNENDEPYIYIMAPITEEKNVTGIIATSYSIDYFYTYILKPSYSGSGETFMVTPYLNVLTKDNGFISLDQLLPNIHFERGVTKDNILTEMSQDKTGIVHCESNSIKYYLQYTPSTLNGWYMLSVSEKNSVLKDFDIMSSETKSLYNNIIAIVIVLLLFVLTILNIINIRSKSNQAKLAVEKERYKTVFELSSGVLWEYDIKTDTLTKSDPDLGIHTGLAVTPNFQDYVISNQLILEEDIPTFKEFFNNLEFGLQNLICEIRAKDISDEYKWFELSATSIINENNEPITVIGQTVNIDMKKRELDELRSTIECDYLTKLYNRKTAESTINYLINEAPDSYLHAFILLDIDNFKTINNKFGYVFGDALLVELATKLSKQFNNEKNVLSRIGGDEFVIFLYDIPNILFAEKQAKHILQILNETFLRQSNDTKITGSIGITIFPSDGDNFKMLLTNADTTLYYSKQHGHNIYNIYNSSTMKPYNYIELNDDVLHSNKYQQLDRSIIDSNMIANTVEILFDARDIISSINMILSLVGSFYDLYYIGILETNEHNHTGHITYDWRQEPITSWEFNAIVPKDTIEYLSELNHQNNNLFYTNSLDMAENYPEYVKNFVWSLGLKGILECGILDNGRLHGCIVYAFNTPNRKWEQHEVDSILLVTKILGGYLNNLRIQEKAKRLQRTDSLTNANNLTTFTEEASDILSKHVGSDYIIFYSDIDKFKLINDTYGYSEGDRILIEFANAMRSITDEDETFGRISADKFIGLFRYDNPKHFLGKIKILNDMMNRIPKTDTDHYRISIIIGLCPINEAYNMSLIIDRANMARKTITNRHKSRYAFFNESMKSNLIKQREIEDVMESSLENEDYLVYYQPKVHLNDNTICGAEALVRWMHPEKGLIPPNEFIPIFEENQFIIKLDYYVFEHVCKHIRKMIDLNQEVYPVSVNFSRLHLNSSDMIEKLKTIVDKYNVPTHYLELELTESALQENENFMFTILVKLHKMGFRISMDDFGSGLSSLNLLRTLPCDVLKLDKDFFQQETSTERERIVITNIVKMAQELHMTIVSEGVETEEQAAFLRSIHCDMAQGYLYAKPMPEDEYEATYYNILE